MKLHDEMKFGIVSGYLILAITDFWSFPVPSAILKVPAEVLLW
jgi:hypothetical protein